MDKIRQRRFQNSSIDEQNIEVVEIMTTFEDNDKIVYTIQLTGKQIREFLASVEADDNPSLMWLEKIMQKAVCKKSKRSKT